MSKEQKELTFTLSVEDANVILNALAKQPFEVVAPIIATLREQAAPQLKGDEASAEQQS